MDSDLDVEAAFAAAGTRPLRDWLERVRRVAEVPVVDKWLGFVNPVGLDADDLDPRLRGGCAPRASSSASDRAVQP